jgi:hypothetical protein
MVYRATVVLQPIQSHASTPEPQRDPRKERQLMSEIPSSNTQRSAARRWRRASADITKSFVASLATGENPATSGSTIAAPGHGAAGRTYTSRRALQSKPRTRGSQPSRGARA